MGDYVLAWGDLFAAETLSLFSQEVQNSTIRRNSQLIKKRFEHKPIQ